MADSERTTMSASSSSSSSSQEPTTTGDAGCQQQQQQGQTPLRSLHMATEESNKAPPLRDRTYTMDMEDDRMQVMTGSYSEIFESDSSSSHNPFLPCDACHIPGPKKTTAGIKGQVSKRPDTLPLDEESEESRIHRSFGALGLEGTVSQEGDMVVFVAEDLENKIRLSSPDSSTAGKAVLGSGVKTSSTASLYRQALQPSLPSLDPNVLNDLEMEARRVATSVDTLIENLSGILHSVSALTVDCLEAYRDAVCKTCDSVDSNIKAMYQLMAKCEELSKTMKPVYKVSEQIKEIKRLLDLLENM